MKNSKKAYLVQRVEWTGTTLGYTATGPQWFLHSRSPIQAARAMSTWQKVNLGSRYVRLRVTRVRERARIDDPVLLVAKDYGISLGCYVRTIEKRA